MFFYFDPNYLIIVGPAFLLAIIAQLWVKGTFAKYSRVAASSGYSGAETAQRILQANDIYDVRIEPTRGFLSDHYDPRSRVLRLSPEIYQGRSLASIGVAAHEAGHALQHAHGYAPLHLRTGLVPMTMVGSWLAWPLFFIGMFISGLQILAWAGVLMFGAVVLFQLVTLPVEFNASSRAVALIQELGIVRSSEADGARRVLNAAAMTYVAAAIQSLLTLLYFLMRLGVFGGRDE